jgi:hypothetical protein
MFKPTGAVAATIATDDGRHGRLTITSVCMVSKLGQYQNMHSLAETALTMRFYKESTLPPTVKDSPKTAVKVAIANKARK